MNKLETILCPVDFSEPSQRALDYAASLAKELGASLHLLHVFQLPMYVGLESGPTAVAASTQYLEELRKRADKQVQDAVETCKKEHGVPVSGTVAEGAAHLAIVDAAKDADMVVMGTHGRSGLPRLVLGSVAERVVRLASCPVLTVPPERE